MIMPRYSRESAVLMPQALYSAEAEKAVIGCMMAQPGEVIEEVDGVLVKGDFFVPAHQELFVALKELWDTKQAIDIMMIHQWLSDRKIAESIGSPGILGEMLVGFATHLNVGSYIRIVKDKSLLRALTNACSKIVQDVTDFPDSVASVLDRAETEIFRVTHLHISGMHSIKSASEMVQSFREHRAKIEAGTIESRWLTGLPTLDHGNGGLPRPSYVVIAGEQGTGKSALMLKLMKAAAQNGYNCGAFSMEMTDNQIIQRQVAEVAEIDSRRLNGKIHDNEHVRVEQALDLIKTMPYFVNSDSNLTPADLRSGTRRFVQLGCKIIFLDNLQLMEGSDDRDTRVRQLTQVSRTIQSLQKEYDVTFILLAQVTREAKKKGNLQAYDVADCSAIENDARVMIMLEKGAGSENANASTYPILARIVKYSEGQTGEFPIVFNKKEQRMDEPGNQPQTQTPQLI